MRIEVTSALLAAIVTAAGCSASQPEAATNIATTSSPAGKDASMPDHAILVHITSLPDDAGLDSIEDPLIEAIENAGVGEFDGNEIGPEEAVLYMYGPDGDALWAIIEPILRAAPLGEGSYATVRYGEPGAEERRVELG